MREGLQPIGGPRLRARTTPRTHQKHRNDCIDPEDGSIDCVCGLSDWLQAEADAAAERHLDD